MVSQNFQIQRSRFRALVWQRGLLAYRVSPQEAWGMEDEAPGVETSVPSWTLAELKMAKLSAFLLLEC